MRAKNVWLRDLYGSSYGSANPAATSAAAIPRPRNTRPSTSERHNIRSCVQYRPRFGLGAISTRSWAASINRELYNEAIHEYRDAIWAQHSDEFYCFRHRHEAVHLAATPGHAPRGCPHSIGDSSHIPVRRAELSYPGGRILLAFVGIRYPGCVWRSSCSHPC